ncbi:MULTISPECIES: hypothetical protein [Saccharothrix]|uniref:hypothetical protein n=1 Tax=Saccharothrix TaxID=2071 RepID=UPI0013011ED6|nr:hypothetical protein [Saccharothrix sp. CB00851]
MAGAVVEYEALLADRLRVLGPDHPRTLINRGNLALRQAMVKLQGISPPGPTHDTR